MKGISPIIASVLLIAITMSIAVVLAAYVTSYTRTTLTSIPTACVGGAVFFASADYPRLDTTTCKLTAVVESQFVTLSSFKFDILRTDGSTETKADTKGLTLQPGDAGTIEATATSTCTDVDKVRVTTSCFNVRTDWTTPNIV